MGKGLADCTDYSNKSTEPDKGDGGWFFEQLKDFDKNRPYLGDTPISDKTKGINKINAERLMTFNNKIYVTLQIEENSPIKTQILTMDGKLIYNKTLKGSKGQVTINTNSLSNGFYILKLSSNNITKSFKFNKM